MKKPLPVKIVEALGWTYVALASLPFVASVVSAAVFGRGRVDGWTFVLSCIFLLALTVGMVLSLRRGRRVLFLMAHIVVTAAAALGIVPLLGGMILEASAVFIALLALPFVLLWLPPSGLWFREKLGGKAEPEGCIYGFLAILGVIAGTIIPEFVGSYRSGMTLANANAMAIRGRDLFVRMARNEQDRKGGQNRVDPAACTNSTQFVQALCEKYKGDFGERSVNLGPYTNIWCIAVNPPEDDAFPLIFTCNIDPRELMCPQDENLPLKLTCPKAWGGTCFRFCEKAAVIVRAGGASGVWKCKYARSKNIFRAGIPKPGPETYFLTPTGRVDLVEEQLGTPRNPCKTPVCAL